ncbi:hypothetical protein V7138_14910 [Bacillus sp. JJ1533]|uniref:hypothetical protein n=1 Tax=Bacillus sp. JJ1533 TaxID=3122959 RepID=UPI002FFFFCC0
MIYKVIDSQTVTVKSETGESTILAVKVNYTSAEQNINHTKVFEFEPAISDEEIKTQIEAYGKDLIQNEEKIRVVNLEGVIS